MKQNAVLGCLAKVIRVVTVAPFMALFAFVLMYLVNPSLFGNLTIFLMILGCLVVLPLLAYPLQPLFPKYRGQGREGQRNLAILMAEFGYLLSLLFAWLLHAPKTTWLVVLTYFFSALLIAFFNKVLHIRASGHACGIAGPIYLLIFVVGAWALFGLITLGAAWWASRQMGRHTNREFLIGSLISGAALFGSALITGLL